MQTISQGELRQIGKRRARRAALTLLTATLIISVAAGAVPQAAADDLPGGWPATCVALNDLAEASLGRPENVGIYQRAHGDQAEQACQADHRANVRAAFAWASSTSAHHIPVEPSPGGWPVTCVALNDLVEPSLGRPENVGIYQRAYGDQAEVACQTDHRSDVQAAFHWALPASAPEPEPTPYAPVVARVFEQPIHECQTHDVDEPSLKLHSPLLSSFTLEATVHQKLHMSVVDLVMRLPQFDEFSDLVGMELAQSVPQEYAPQSHWSLSRFERLSLSTYGSSLNYNWYKSQNEWSPGSADIPNPDGYFWRGIDARLPYRLRLSYENGEATLYINETLQYSSWRGIFGSMQQYKTWMPEELPYPWIVVEIGCRGLVTLSDIRIDGVAVNAHSVRHLLAEPSSRPNPDPSSFTVLGRRPDFNCHDKTLPFALPMLSSFSFESTVHNKQHSSRAEIWLEFPNVIALSDVVGADLASEIPFLYAPRGYGPSLRYDRLYFGRQGERTLAWYVARFTQRYDRNGWPIWESDLHSSETGASLLDPSLPYTLHLAYQNGHIELYINGQLKHTEKGLPYPWMQLQLHCDGPVTFSGMSIEGVGVDARRVTNFLSHLDQTG